MTFEVKICKAVNLLITDFWLSHYSTSTPVKCIRKMFTEVTEKQRRGLLDLHTTQSVLAAGGVALMSAH